MTGEAAALAGRSEGTDCGREFAAPAGRSEGADCGREFGARRARLRCGAEGWVGGAASFRMARLRCLAGDYIAEKVARKGKLVLPGGDTAVFVPVVVEPLAVGRPAIPMTEAGAVRIEIAGVVLPVGSDCGPDRAAAWG